MKLIRWHVVDIIQPSNLFIYFYCYYYYNFFPVILKRVLRSINAKENAGKVKKQNKTCTHARSPILRRPDTPGIGSTVSSLGCTPPQWKRDSCSRRDPGCTWTYTAAWTDTAWDCRSPGTWSRAERHRWSAGKWFSGCLSRCRKLRSARKSNTNKKQSVNFPHAHEAYSQVRRRG